MVSIIGNNYLHNKNLMFFKNLKVIYLNIKVEKENCNLKKINYKEKTQ